jgi:hypothetical protein
MSEYTAIWQCPRCHRVLQHEFSNDITYSLEGNLYCPCYGLRSPVGCVELRTITKMIPLNDAAKGHEESCRSMREYHEEQRREALRRQESLENWTYYGMIRS